VARLQASGPRLSTTNARISRSAAMLRNRSRARPHVHVVFSTCGWTWLGVTLALLVSIHPALALLAVFGLPTVLTSSWRRAWKGAAEERAHRQSPRATSVRLATTAPPGKEVRVTPIGARLCRTRRETWSAGMDLVADGRRQLADRMVARARATSDLRYVPPWLASTCPDQRSHVSRRCDTSGRRLGKRVPLCPAETSLPGSNRCRARRLADAPRSSPRAHARPPA